MIMQFQNKKLNRAAIEASLRHDESIVCENATVIADKNGNVTGWINNDIPLCVILRDDEEE